MTITSKEEKKYQNTIANFGLTTRMGTEYGKRNYDCPNRNRRIHNRNSQSAQMRWLHRQ